jgi:isoleucyl-tRNA synthetase
MNQELTEEQILKFWKDKKIYEKSKEKNKNGKKFYFMDGPPYASGHIHMGTALNKILKDIAMRSQRLQGRDVFDRPGYDTHGLPIEFQVEKEIGSKSKEDIEKYGIKKFIEKCKKYATQFIDVMNKEFLNLGTWFDFSNPYLTLSPEYIEKIWEVFKIADQKDLLYLGKYPVHVCPRCETAVAFNEIEYAKQTDTSVFVKFPLTEKGKENTSLIIWTTTPWTLPANTGVMVNPSFDYQEIELSSGEKWIIAKELVPKIMAQLETGFTPKKTYKGKEMKDWKYTNPLSKHLKLNLDPKNSYKVVLSARYVNLEEGTGLVHTAPGHGKEDYEIGKKHKLEAPSPVDISGKLTEETGKYAGKKARIVDAEIIEDLEADNMLVQKLKYSHDYPLCWRCKSPLLMLQQPQWFLKISEIHKQILKENEKTKWLPKYMQLRMKAWLEGVSDWPVSRERYWGTPLPIWTCDNENCDERIVIGSVKELEKLSKSKVKEIHKPEIDKITIPCKKCKGKMSRVTEVLDVWFDSGVSSWAALETEAQIKKFWPADLNIEGKDQFRGWWNSQLILSQIKFGRRPFENISVHGMVLDISKRKMSKSQGNITAPKEVIEKYSRDYLRYYFAKISKGEDFSFQDREFKEIRKTFMMISNVAKFVEQLEGKIAPAKIEDKWILSRFNSTIQQVTKNYNEFNFPEVIKLLDNFLVNDLSRTYIKIIRDRAEETKPLLQKILIGTLQLFAPIAPFITEKIWQSLDQREESIHLTTLPKSDTKKINEGLEARFNTLLKIIELGLFERDKEKLGLKWPLPKMTILVKGQENYKELTEIIKSQLNVKEIELKSAETSKETGLEIKLDTTLTPELEAEGFAREISRFIQAQRKKASLIKTDLINLEIISKDLSNILEKQENFIKERTNAKNMTITTQESGGKFSHSEEGKIKEKSFIIRFNKS